MIVNGMSSVRVNWLKAFEAKFGRKPVVTRQELVAFAESWSEGERGGVGLVLRYPSWLTNPKPNPYKVGKAAYRLPWNELESWEEVIRGNAPEASEASNAISEQIVTKVEESV